MKLFSDKYTGFEKFCIVFYLGFVLFMAYYYIFPEAKIKDYFHNEKYHYKIGKHTDFYMVRKYSNESIIFRRVIKRKPRSIYLDNIFYGVKIESKNSCFENTANLNEKDFLKYKDEFIEYHKEKIVEIRDTRIINIKPKHRGIYMSLIFRDNDTKKTYYYYDTRVWANGNMYSIGLIADLETIKSRERRVDNDIDYSHTYMQILNSMQIEGE